MTGVQTCALPIFVFLLLEMENYCSFQRFTLVNFSKYFYMFDDLYMYQALGIGALEAR